MHINFNLSKNILAWYDNNKRILPWRVNKKHKHKLYYRLLSEFMLQQTQVKTVLPYFLRFINHYPTLKSLSQIKEKRILKLWEGLGYYRRAKNLLSTTKLLAKNDFSLPNTLEEIKKLPGVGNYTANALLALVHDQQTLAVDGNVKRVFSRLLNVKENEINFENLISANKSKIFNEKRNADVVEAFMEFGAIVCKPKNPECGLCNLKKNCNFNNGIIRKKKIIKKIFKIQKINIFCYLNKNKKIALTKKGNFGFLKNFVLPQIKMRQKNLCKKWNFLSSYDQNISNKKFKIYLYYKFSKKIPRDFKWYKINNKNEIIPTFTKIILNKVESLF